MRRAFPFAILAVTLALGTMTASAEVCHPAPARHVHKAAVHSVGGVGVTIDQARMVAFSRPVKTLYVGNPTIVDVSMVDSEHAFVLGKTFGVTNMIALAADGTQVSNQLVTVLNNGAAVTVNRGPDQFNYMCTAAHCETAPRPGDPNSYVSTTEATASQHEGNATAAGNAVASSQSASSQ